MERIHIILIILVLLLSGCGRYQLVKFPDFGRHESASQDSTEPSVEPSAAFPQVLYDQQGIRITAEDVRIQTNQCAVSLSIDNQTDQDYIISTRSYGYQMNAVNSWMIDDGKMDAEVPAGQTRQSQVVFDRERLHDLGIKDIAEISLNFCIRQINDRSDGIPSGPVSITVGPPAEDTAMCLSDILHNLYPGARSISDTQKSIYDQADIQILEEACVAAGTDQLLVLKVQNNNVQPGYMNFSHIDVNQYVLRVGLWGGQWILPDKQALVVIKLNALTNENDWQLLNLNSIHSLSYKVGLSNGRGSALAEYKTVSFTVQSGPNPPYDGGILYQNTGVVIKNASMYVENSDLQWLHWPVVVTTNNTYPIYMTDSGKAEINGQMIDSYAYCPDLETGESAVMTISFLLTDLVANHINPSDIQKIRWSCDIRNKRTGVVMDTALIGFGG